MENKTREKEAKPRRKPVPIIIPNAESLTPEELSKAKHAEKMRRYMARKRGEERGEVEEVDPGQTKKTKQEIMKLDTNEMIALAKDTRNVSLQVLNMKLLELSQDPVALSKINLATLATTFGIMYDKGQLMDGLATSNIAIHAKIDLTMSSEQAMSELDKMRESYTEENK